MLVHLVLTTVCSADYSSTQKTSVNFICMLAILGELCWLEFFKTVYLETSNVRFGSFLQNPVTFVRDGPGWPYCWNIFYLEKC